MAGARFGRPSGVGHTVARDGDRQGRAADDGARAARPVRLCAARGDGGGGGGERARGAVRAPPGARRRRRRGRLERTAAREARRADRGSGGRRAGGARGPRPVGGARVLLDAGTRPRARLAAGDGRRRAAGAAPTRDVGGGDRRRARGARGGRAARPSTARRARGARGARKRLGWLGRRSVRARRGVRSGSGNAEAPGGAWPRAPERGRGRPPAGVRRGGGAGAIGLADARAGQRGGRDRGGDRLRRRRPTAAAPRRHRLGEDRGLPRRGGRGARAGTQRDRPRPRDRPHPPDARPLPRPLRRRGRAASLAAPGRRPL